MSEPCQQGKSFISFFLSVILKIDAKNKHAPYFDAHEHKMIEGILGSHKREQIAMLDPRIKLGWEDKHIFDPEKLNIIAQQLDFSRFYSFDTESINDGWRSQCERVMRIMGVTKSLSPFSFLFDSFQEEYLSFNGNAVQTPHQFLVFEK